MTSRRTRILASGLAAVSLAGCGAGQRAQTYVQRSTEDSTNDAIGTLALRNVAIATPSGPTYKAGSDARLTFSFVNQGDQPDTLVSATTDAASSVVFLKGISEIPSIGVPALGASAADETLLLRGLTRDLRPGQYVSMTLSFTVNGRKTMLVPVLAPLDQRRPDRTPSRGEGEGGPTLGDEGQPGASAAPPV